ncbi:tryptophan--tRNA ligase [Luedemannella flava]|uniref:Tryptophan--tRNA ligase n=1 Tax=Luedemannella flava TaxID=349316 RepID=A0ABP4YE20_9ACTN
MITSVSPDRLAPPPGARPPTARRLSGFKPTGRLQLGNYLGAVRPMIESQRDHEPIVMIVNLHALTVQHDPARLRDHTTRMLATLLAAGVDTNRTLCYLQSDVPEHAELHYLLECATGYGEAARMIQFKEKSRGNAAVRLSLLTYPVLMAADILLHDADEVPVGEDQTQHLELARDVANRFNTRYGHTFVVPRGVTPSVAARVMDLADPISKMGKTATHDGGVIFLLDPPDTIARKIARAVTDPAPDVAYDPDRRPGAANLLEILAALRPGSTPAGLAAGLGSYRHLKDEVTEAVVEALRPLRARYDALIADRGHLDHVRRAGAARARERAARTVARAKDAIGIP